MFGSYGPPRSRAADAGAATAHGQSRHGRRAGRRRLRRGDGRAGLPPHAACANRHAHGPCPWPCARARTEVPNGQAKYRTAKRSEVYFAHSLAEPGRGGARRGGRAAHTRAAPRGRGPGLKRQAQGGAGGGPPPPAPAPAQKKKSPIRNIRYATILSGKCANIKYTTLPAAPRPQSRDLPHNHKARTVESERDRACARQPMM